MIARSARKHLPKPERKQKQREQLPQQTVVDKLRSICSYDRAEQAAQSGLFNEHFVYQMIFEVENQRNKRYRQKKQQIYSLSGSLLHILENGEPHHKYKAASQAH